MKFSLRRLRQIPSIAFPIMLLGVEILGLTPFVEFRAGPITYLANSELLQCGMLGLVIYLSLRQPVTDGEADATASYLRRGTLWYVIHMLFYLSFAALTFWWNDVHTAYRDHWWNWGVPVAWSLLALAVGYSACRIVFPTRQLLRELQPQATAIAGAVAGVGLYGVYLWYRLDIWEYAYQPMLYLALWVMVHVRGAGVLGLADDGLPIFGSRLVQLKVTAYCDGLEAIAMFWAWWLVLLIHRRDEEGILDSWLARLFVGTIVLWLLNTLRMDVLVWLGEWKGPWLSVRMAHSQWWAIGALCLSAGILLWPRGHYKKSLPDGIREG